jgi:hypothetical protein
VRNGVAGIVADGTFIYIMAIDTIDGENWICDNGKDKYKHSIFSEAITVGNGKTMPRFILITSSNRLA